ncbi:hypothetical protein [Terriglobus sp. RCC_193]|uniref:hypothetical protein n=1 Tax=Terriglobus sp. RCC_193 TaxID=3239218 RepID=UPI003526705D
MGSTAQLEILLDQNGAIRGWKEFSDQADKGKQSVDSVTVSLGKQAEAADRAGEKSEAGQKKATAAATDAKKAVDAYAASVKAASTAQDTQIANLEKNQQRVAKAQASFVSGSMSTSRGASGRFVSNSSDSGLGETANIEKQLNNANAAATKFRQTGTKALDDVHEHSLKPIDSLRQVRDIFGIEITGAMEKVIAASPALMNGIMALGKVAVVGGYAMIGISIAKGMYEGYKAVSELNGGLKDYRTEAEKSQREDIINNASLEQAKRNLAELTQEMQEFDRSAKAAGYDVDSDRGSVLQWLGYSAQAQVNAEGLNTSGKGQPEAASPIMQRQVDAQVQRIAAAEKAQQRIRQLQQEIALQNKQSDLGVSVAGLQGPALLAAQERADKELANFRAQQAQGENRARFDARNETIAKIRKIPGVHEDNLPPSLTLDEKSGEAQRQQDLSDAQRQGEVRRRAMALQAHEEVITIDHAAQVTSLRGEAAFQKQAEQQYEDYTRQYGASAEARAAIDRKYQAERQQRLDTENMTSNQTSRAAEIAGMQGVGRTQAQLNVDLAKINDDEKAGHYVSADNAEKDRESARIRAAADIAQQVKQFNRDIDDSYTQSVTSTLSGFAQIDAESAATTKRMRQHFDDLWTDAQRGTAEYAAALQKELAAEDAARQESARKQARLMRDNADETVTMEEEARRRSLPVWQQAQQEILDNYADRRRKLDEMLNDAEIGEADYQRRVIAMDREKNAELQQNARDTRDRIASTLQGFITDPMQALRQQAESSMAKSAADIFLRYGSKFTGAQGGSGGMFSGMDKLPWIHGIGGGSMTVPVGGMQAPMGAAASALQVGTATIQVGTATIIGGGAPGASMASGLPAGLAPLMSSAGGYTTNLRTGASAFTPFSTGGMPMVSAIPSSVQGLGSSSGSGLALANSTLGYATQAKSAIDFAKSFNSDDKGGVITGHSSGGSIIDMANEDDSTSKPSDWQKGGGLLGAGQAGLGLWGAYQSKSVLGGMLGGAMSGAKLGGMIAGPGGALVGAAAGALVGLFGDHGRSQAKQYDEKTVQPWIADEFKSFEQSGGDYLSIYSDMDAFSASSKAQTDQWGTGAQSYYSDTIKPEITAAQAKLTKLQKAGRSQFQFTAAQYHTGDLISSFGDFSTSPTEGMVNAEIGEFMVRSNPAKAHLSTLRAINSGVSPEELAKSYQSSIDTDRRQRMMQTVTRNTHITVQALDSDSFHRAARRNAGTLRAVINDSIGDSAGFGS